MRKCSETSYGHLWSRRSLTSSTQLGESFQRGGADVSRALGSMLFAGALLRRSACQSKHTATGSMFEGRDILVARSSKGGNLKP